MYRKTKLKKILLSVLSAVTLGLFGISRFYAENIPDSFYIEKENNLNIASYPVITASAKNETATVDSLTYPKTQEVSLKLFGVIPVKSVEVCQTEAPVLIVGGTPFGIKLLMDGVMVIQLNESDDICPAKTAGIEVGDIIQKINDIPVMSNSEIQKIISSSNGNTLKISAIRNGKQFEVSLTPIWNDEKRCYIGGMWVRDSIAGIGTMTFIDKSTGSFAGLGHPVCDSDTGEIIPISSGKAVPIEVTDVVKGKNGVPGELNGCFTSDECIGDLELNNRCGIFGTLADSAIELCYSEEYKMGFKQDIHTGKAFILCTTDGSQPEKYEIEIESIDYNGEDNTKNMVIRITDEKLIEKTGGIVQGMSGSPIIQDNLLIGAVTHVFISDPEKGYGIFAENMIEYIK